MKDNSLNITPEELERSTSELSLLHCINNASNLGDPLEVVLQRTAKGIKEIFRLAACNIFLLDEDKEYLELVELSVDSKVLEKIEKLSGFKARGFRVPLFEGSSFTRAIRDCETIYSEDLTQMFGDYFKDSALRKYASMAARVAGYKSALRVPLVVEGEARGVIGVASKRTISDEEIEILKGFAAQVSIIIGKVMAEKALKESEERLRLLTDAAQEGICVHDKGKFIDSNNKFVQMLGYDSISELKGLTVLDMVAEGSRDTVTANIKKEYEETYEAELLRKDGSTFPVMIKGRKYPIKGKITRVVSVTDISSQKEAENRIRASLKEKDVLLMEVHHRVKNNMAIIASMISLQMSQTENKESEDILMSSFNRIRTMSHVHELLYASESLTDIELKPYIKTIAVNVISSLRAETREIHLTVDVEQTPLGINELIPIGLILNEAITNSIKHAFENTEKPGISIKVKKDDGYLVMIVEDNGSGFKGKNFNQNESLGGKIIEALVKQLMGKLNISSDKSGTKIEIKCPLKDA